ncbi:MAG: hypothetical protein AAFY56_22505 [Pseudomonadota bacterium]
MVSAMKDTVFIHTNHRQMIGALVSKYSIERRTRHADAFDVRIISIEDYPFFAAKEGEAYLRGGTQRVWLNDDLQSFTPLRFGPPGLMNYQGRAIVIDPDVFANADIYELLSRDMEGKVLMCRGRDGHKKLSSAVMLMDCAKLTHWKLDEQFNEMFKGKRDYMDWISLKLEDPESIGLFEPEWNDFDKLSERTKLLHNTKRWHQPWKTGLPVDFTPAGKSGALNPVAWYRRAREALFGRYGMLGTYKPHWDPNQEQFFFGLLRECIEKGVVTEAMLRQEMQRNHIRHDAFEVLERTPPLAA